MRAPGDGVTALTELAGAELIPGDPAAVAELATHLEQWSGLFADGARDLTRIDLVWTGAAADAFRAVYPRHVDAWKGASQAFGRAASAMDGYAKELAAAQERAARAAASARAGIAQTRERLAANPLTAVAQPDAVVESLSDPLCLAASADVAQARQAVEQAGDVAADTLDQAVQAAPDAPSWWDTATAVAEANAAVGRGLAAGMLDQVHDDVIVPLVNGVADVGQAVKGNPVADGQIIGGLLLGSVGSGLMGGGTALDVTGIGAFLGVPAQVAGVAVVRAGAGISAAGAGTIAKDALDGNANILQTKANTKREGHWAGYKITGSDGQFRAGGGLGRRPMLLEEKALPFPDGMYAAHTEARILRWNELRRGDTVEIGGTEPPCRECRETMQEAADKLDIKIIYRWDDQVKTFG